MHAVAPTEDHEEDGDLRVLRFGLFEGVFNPAEVSFAVAIDDEDLADGEADGFRVRLRGGREREQDCEDAKTSEEVKR